MKKRINKDFKFNLTSNLNHLHSTVRCRCPLLACLTLTVSLCSALDVSLLPRSMDLHLHSYISILLHLSLFLKSNNNQMSASKSLLKVMDRPVKIVLHLKFISTTLLTITIKSNNLNAWSKLAFLSLNNHPLRNATLE
jgi:hypothetical protein